LTYHFFDLTIM